jgi:helicase MOV-10
VVKLTKNFRSHEAILQFPNEKFYRGDLVSCGNPAIIDSFLRSPYLPSKRFPVVFHAVYGKDDREASSPSFFNIEEILQVKYYVQKLKRDRRFITGKYSLLRKISSLTSDFYFFPSFLSIEDRDIGIIAPYHAQCLKLRKALRDVANDVKIGSVEEFQGQVCLVSSY